MSDGWNTCSSRPEHRRGHTRWENSSCRGLWVAASTVKITACWFCGCELYFVGKKIGLIGWGEIMEALQGKQRSLGFDVLNSEMSVLEWSNDVATRRLAVGRLRGVGRGSQDGPRRLLHEPSWVVIRTWPAVWRISDGAWEPRRMNSQALGRTSG